MALRRIKKELQYITTDIPNCLQELYVLNNPFIWYILIKGRLNTLYQTGYFWIKFELPKDYPFKRRKYNFLNKIYSCYINDKGRWCLDIIDWSSAMTIYKILIN